MKSKIQNPKPKIRVLIVDDSLAVRKKIIGILEESSDITVAGEAENGKQAIALTKKLRPDVILMDIIMPVMTGVSATEYIMCHQPTAIVIHLSSSQRGEMYKAWDAMKSGALAMIDKDLSNNNIVKWEREMVQTIKAACRVKLVTSRKTKINKTKKRSANLPEQDHFNLIAIGASTGGPGIIPKIIKSFPPDYILPIVIVLHIPSSQKCTFAEWLDEECHLDVDIAKDGQLLSRVQGQVLVAPPDRHIIVKGMSIRIIDSKPVHSCRPSVDVFFESIAKEKQIKPVAVLLSGIGKDGAAGLKKIRNSGGYTICQDEKTSTVFGMPKAAISMDAADITLPDYEIADTILNTTRRQVKK